MFSTFHFIIKSALDIFFSPLFSIPSRITIATVRYSIVSNVSVSIMFVVFPFPFLITYSYNTTPNTAYALSILLL